MTGRGSGWRKSAFPKAASALGPRATVPTASSSRTRLKCFLLLATPMFAVPQPGAPFLLSRAGTAGVNENVRLVGKNRKRKVSVDLEQLQKIVELTQERALSAEEHEELQKGHQVLVDLLLPKLQTEKSKKLLELAEEGEEAGERRTRGPAKSREAFFAAKHVKVEHQELQAGQPCPCCGDWKLSRSHRPQVFRHFVGQTPIQLTFYEREVLVCKACDKPFAAPLPQEVGTEEYSPSCVGLISLYKYGLGNPFYRQESLFKSLGTPIAVSTMFELMAKATERLAPIHDRLRQVAANSPLAYLDDTSMKILRFERQEADDRTGLFTTGIVAEGDHKVALLFTGRNHAGENMKELRQERSPDLAAMMQMSDALSRNFVDLEDDDLVACCLVHGRRNFVNIIDDFPEECRQILESLGSVYRNDRHTKDQQLSPEDRLKYHQEHSQPVMDKLKAWLERAKADKIAEPNSKLGKAMQYLLNHWEGLTLFLRVAGAPLDNNTAERCLKKVVLHRKNSLFYRTIRGAKVGDVHMSIIQTCQLNGIDPFDYLTQALTHWEKLSAATADAWLPWNYRATIEALEAVKA